MTATRNASRIMLAFAVVFATACGGGEKAQQTAQVPAAGGGAGSDRPDGAVVYQRCATCHQPTGVGTPGVFPPLAGSGIANGPASIPIRIVMRGLMGPVTVKGQEFNGVMPAYGIGVEMTDAEVAAVLTHVRSSFGNKGGAVTPEEVARERAAIASKAGPWTAAELGIK